MKKEISQKIKTLVSDNRLEEALDVLIGVEKDKNRERYNTLILLKGKLEMLEEQELAGLLDFDELARQKLRIAHALLEMTDSKTPSIPAETPMPRHRAPVYKYLLFAVLALGLVWVVVPKPETPKDNSPQKKDQKTTPPKQQPIAPIENHNPHTPQTTPDNKTAEKPTRKDNQPPTLPTNKTQRVLLKQFPPLNRPFNFGDIRYTFQNARIEKMPDGRLKMTLKINLLCRNNLGTCDREKIRIIADGKPFAPVRQLSTAKNMENKTTITDELIFALPANASAYRIQLSKYRSDWTRGFAIAID
ncbi:MAG TPA: hypothetical protein ENJ20_03425 [Bacteroidetes bacterium]|nr:hypothetical protein [Bacteroidota bacterium]